MNAQDIIDKIGRDLIQAHTGASRPTVNNWISRNAIPGHAWLAISKIPQAKKSGVTLEVLAAHLGNKASARMET